MHSGFVPVEHAGLVRNFADATADPNQMRWLPEPLLPAAASSVGPAGSSGSGAGSSSSSSSSGGGGGSAADVDWLRGLRTMAGNGDPTTKSGLAVYVYNCNASMVNSALMNSDGEMLIVPQVCVCVAPWNRTLWDNARRRLRTRQGRTECA